jgi:putative ABC transport system permease protein
LETLDSILGKVSFVIRFMASFTVLTGLLVLAGAILTGRYQRLQESVLLRTLGASRAQVLKILVVEYACLGALAAFTGLLLALAASGALATFVFEVRFVPPVWPLMAALVGVSALTVVTGLLTSLGILNHPPLAILRAEC